MSSLKEKSVDTRNCIAIYNILLQTRIKLQKSLNVINKIPPKQKLSIDGVSKGCLSALEQLNTGSAKASKRKLDSIEAELSNDHKRLCEDRTRILNEWYNRISAVSASSDSFHKFNRSPVELISKALENRDRLVERTQIDRMNRDDVIVSRDPQSRSRDKTYDAEVFDDSDYYAQLLSDFINSKTSEVSDPLVLGQHWTEVQKLRSKIKNKVDTRASKGRKIRYTVMPKLENFISTRDFIKPPRHPIYSDQQKEMLFARLFGQEEIQSG